MNKEMQGKNIKRWASAVILSIKSCLGGWCQVTICRRETGWQSHRLTLQYGRPSRKVENDHLLLGLALQLRVMLMALLSPSSVFLCLSFWCENFLEGLSQQNTLRSKDQNPLGSACCPVLLRWHMFISCNALTLMLNQMIFHAWYCEVNQF